VFACKVKNYSDITLGNLYKLPYSSATFKLEKNITIVIDSNNNILDFIPKLLSMRPLCLRGPQRS
jgi:hypothetical protein